MSEIETALEQLYSDERLTSNLTDPQATALLKWAEAQILAGVAVASVRSATAAANRDGSGDEAAVVAVASAALQSTLPADRPTLAAVGSVAAPPLPEPAAAADSSPQTALPDPGVASDRAALPALATDSARPDTDSAPPISTALALRSASVPLARRRRCLGRQREPICPPRRRRQRRFNS